MQVVEVLGALEGHEDHRPVVDSADDPVVESGVGSVVAIGSAAAVGPVAVTTVDVAILSDAPVVYSDAVSVVTVGSVVAVGTVAVGTVEDGIGLANVAEIMARIRNLRYMMT